MPQKPRIPRLAGPSFFFGSDGQSSTFLMPDHDGPTYTFSGSPRSGMRTGVFLGPSLRERLLIEEELQT